VKQSDILIVDDTPDNLNLLSRLLKKQGYTVRTAINGQLALQSIQTDPPVLILLDVVMPEMDGFEVCQRLKSNKQVQHVPVIFLSGLNELSYKIRAFEVGGVDYITKPFHAEEVLAKIRNYMTVQHTLQQLERQNARLQKELAERKESEASMSRTEQAWNKTFDAVQDCIFVLDQDFRILHINKAAAHRLALEPSTCIGRKCHALFSEKAGN